MALSINPTKNHRGREKGLLVYPVYSRRSRGLSVGINLFPDKKFCPFDCPYCEVFPFENNSFFLLPQMEADLREAIAAALEQDIPIKDICFSGNGEPSLSPDFPEALKLAASIREELAPCASMVLITNGAGLMKPQIFSRLLDAVLGSEKLDVWLKLDAGTPEWYKKINRCEIPFEEITLKKKEFASCAPVTIQTMLCSVEGERPSAEESHAWLEFLLGLAASGNIRKVQIYGKARSAPGDPLASSLPVEYLEERASSLRRSLEAGGFSLPVEVFP
ncbi:MAG: radical SAM protein [Treponema sp.]|jgi:histidinol dehydrogenase|nr:radical SAM protein [Treponema sp.]